MTLLETLTKASDDLERDEFADVSDTMRQLIILATAAGEFDISKDTLVGVDIHPSCISIRTTWVSMGYADGGTYSFPRYIIESEHPIKEATQWGLELRINDKKQQLEEGRRNIYVWSEQLLKLQADLRAAR